MSARSALLNVMVSAALKASRRLVRDFGEVEQLQVSRKGPADFVTNADLKAESILFEELSRARPDYGFLLEERGVVRGESDTRWIIDPLDGTTNFLHGLPHFAISIGVEERGQIIAGVIFDPIKDEMFWAEKGRGAFMNDRRIRVSARDRMDQSLLATGIPWKGRGGHDQYSEELAVIMPRVAGIRRFGSAALDMAYVAAGRYECYWENSLEAWDLAAGLVLVREAGGIVSEIDGGDQILKTGSILAANSSMHAPMAKLLAPFAHKSKN